MVAYERQIYNYCFIVRQVIHDLRNNLNETENEDTFYEDNLEAFLAHNLRAELAADLTKYSDDQGRKNYLFRSIPRDSTSIRTSHERKNKIHDQHELNLS